MSSAVVATGSAGPAQIELSIGGMTCAACAARVERKLNGLGNVSASVNLATEREEMFGIMDHEAQRCRGALAKQPPKTEKH